MNKLIRVEALLGLVVAATMAAPAFANCPSVPAPGAGMGLAALGVVGVGVRAIKRKFGK